MYRFSSKYGHTSTYKRREDPPPEEKKEDPETYGSYFGGSYESRYRSSGGYSPPNYDNSQEDNSQNDNTQSTYDDGWSTYDDMNNRSRRRRGRRYNY